MKNAKRFGVFLLGLCLILSILTAFMSSEAAADGTDLFFSEYIEGTSNNRAVEIYNPTANTVDLSAYSVLIYANGSSSPSSTIPLSGALGPQAVYVLANSSAHSDILVKADQASGSLTFTGDDAVALRRSGVLVDLIGQIGVDPGTAWSANGVSTMDMTLLRKPSVTQGRTDSGAFDPSLEWIGLPKDTFGYLGNRDFPPEMGLFFSEYVEGSNNNKALEIYNPTNKTINLSGHSVLIYYNGNNSPGSTINLTGTLAPQGIHVLAHGSAHANILARANQTSGSLTFNGNDAVALRWGSVMIDLIGQIGVNPGTAWSVNGVETADMTLLRKPSVTQGRTDSGAFDPSLEWIGLQKDTFGYLGNRDFPSYAVTFSSGTHGHFKTGDPDTQTATVSYGQDASPPEIEPDEGYDFVGWNPSPVNITGPLTTTAQYQKKSYTVTFDPGSSGSHVASSAPLTQEVLHGEGALSPQVMPGPGYTLVGWDLDFRKVTGPLAVNALYKPWGTPGVFFSEYVEGSGPNNKALELFNATGREIDLETEGYSIQTYFNGGITNSTINLVGTIPSRGIFVLGHTGAAAGIASEADQFDSGSWFNGDDVVILKRGSEVIDVIGKMGEVTDPDFDSSQHEKIVGWKMGDVQTGNRTLVRKPWVAEGVTDLVPVIFDPSVQWMVYPQGTYDKLGSHDCDVIHGVTFETGSGGNLSGDLSQTVYHGRAASSPDTDPWPGYIFLDWDSDFSQVTQDIVVSALWKALTFTITFDSQGAGPIPPISQEVDTVITPPEDPSMPGRTFLGWSPALPDRMPAKDMELTALWEIHTYRVDFQATCGTPMKPLELKYGDPIPAPSAPTRPGATFLRWEPALPPTMPAHDLTVTAVWDVDPNTILFDTRGGSPIPPLVQQAGSPVTAPADPVKEGYTFMGWEPEMPAFMPACGIQLKAQWKVNRYTITFRTPGGSSIPPLTLDYGSPIVPPEAPSHPRYQFYGWNPVLPATMPAQDLEVRAIWWLNGIILDSDDQVPGTGMGMSMGAWWTIPACLIGLSFVLLAAALVVRQRKTRVAGRREES